MHLDLKVHSSYLITLHKRNQFRDLTHAKVHYSLNFEGTLSEKGLTLSSLKGLIRSCFQSPKRRGLE